MKNSNQDNSDLSNLFELFKEDQISPKAREGATIYATYKDDGIHYRISLYPDFIVCEGMDPKTGRIYRPLLVDGRIKNSPDYENQMAVQILGGIVNSRI